MNRPYLVCAIGVLAVSFAAIFIRTADAHPIVIAFMRMSLASAMLFLAWLTSSRALPARDHWLWLVGAGVFLALHFVTWISSFGMTSVASSVVLVSTQPLFVLIFSWFLFKHGISIRELGGILLCLVGAMAIAWSDLSHGGLNTLQGNIMAFLGALFAALYFICGKKVRQTLHILPYVTFTYTIAAIALGAVLVILELPVGNFSTQTWGSFLGLSIICTIIGHSSFNYAIAYLPAAVVSIFTLGEPVGATMLAALLLKELPTIGQLTGGGIILCGIWLFLTRAKQGTPTATQQTVDVKSQEW